MENVEQQTLKRVKVFNAITTRNVTVYDVDTKLIYQPRERYILLLNQKIQVSEEDPISGERFFSYYESLPGFLSDGASYILEIKRKRSKCCKYKISRRLDLVLNIKVVEHLFNKLSKYKKATIVELNKEDQKCLKIKLSNSQHYKYLKIKGFKYKPKVTYPGVKMEVLFRLSFSILD